MIDIEYLLLSASQNVLIQPCNDFKEFSLGEFIKYRALNDRLQYIGFLRDVKDNYAERRRKLLDSKINEKNDGRLFKIAKNFFSKCVNSCKALTKHKMWTSSLNLFIYILIELAHIRNNAHKELLQHFNDLGGSPYLLQESWKPSKFNISKLFEKFTWQALTLFFDHEKAMCPDPRYPEEVRKEILCFQENIGWSFTKNIYGDYIDMLQNMKQSYLHGGSGRNEIEKQIAKAVQNTVKYLSSKVFCPIFLKMEFGVYWTFL